MKIEYKSFEMSNDNEVAHDDDDGGIEERDDDDEF